MVVSWLAAKALIVGPQGNKAATCLVTRSHLGLLFFVIMPIVTLDSILARPVPGLKHRPTAGDSFFASSTGDAYVSMMRGIAALRSTPKDGLWGRYVLLRA